MLSSAHVLAMDAKNLLDVVDSLRKRFPSVFMNQNHSPVVVTVDATQQPPNRFQFDSQTPPPPQSTANERANNHTSTDENYQVMTRQSFAASPASPNPNTELYSNQSVSPQPQCGIYDNDCVILGQQSGNISGAVDDPQRTPPKPPVAAKPSNLQQKLKRGQLPLPKDMLPALNSPSDLHGMDEPLRIVEDDMVGEQADDMQLYSNTMAAAHHLPDPVPCSIVQESIKKLSIAASSNIKG